MRGLSLRGPCFFHAEPRHTSAKHALVLTMFLTPNRATLQLNMISRSDHVLHAEPLRTSAKHALVFNVGWNQDHRNGCGNCSKHDGSDQPVIYSIAQDCRHRR